MFVDSKSLIHQAWPIIFSELARLTSTLPAIFCKRIVAMASHNDCDWLKKKIQNNPNPNLIAESLVNQSDTSSLVKNLSLNFKCSQNGAGGLCCLCPVHIIVQIYLPYCFMSFSAKACEDGKAIWQGDFIHITHYDKLFASKGFTQYLNKISKDGRYGDSCTSACKRNTVYRV